MGTTPPPAFPNLPGMTGDWNSSTDFSLGKLSNLYEVAEKSLNQLYGESKFELNPDDLLDLDVIKDYLKDDFADDNVGLIVYITVWLVAAVIFTIIGLCWCCANTCACCCRTSVRGGRGKDMGDLENTDPSMRPYYSERNRFRTLSTGTIIASVFMAFFLIAYLLMIIHTFEANEKTKGTINGIKDGIEDGIGDIDFYISKSNEQLTYVFVTEYNVYVRDVERDLDDLKDKCGTSPVPVDCDAMVEDIMKPIGETGTQLEETSNDLSEALTSVQDEMRDARDTLLNDFQKEIDDADTGIYWGFMLFNVIYAIVFALVLFGTVLATFSRSGGLKTSGHLMIRVAITLIFVVCILVVIQLILMFIFSGVVTEIICPAFRKVEENENPLPPNDPDYQVPGFDFIMQNCNKDESAYKSFHLEKAIDEAVIRTEIKTQFDAVRDDIPDIVKDDFNAIETKTLKYVDNAFSSVKNEIGKCKPVYNAIDSVRNLFCHNVTAPLTAFWWILQFIPVVFLCIVVTGLLLERF